MTGSDGGYAKSVVVQGDATRLGLDDNSVDLIVTSPPYWKLRAYTDNGAEWAGQIGHEKTPAAYTEALISCTREWLRVLKPSGSLFVNLGDKYLGRTLLDLPARYSIACVDRLGLVKRAEIVWSKSNPFIDGKARDRVRRTHEVVLHLTRPGVYFEDVDTIRQHPRANYQDRPQYRRAMELFEAAGFTHKHMAAVRSVGIIDTAGGEVRSGGSWESEAGVLAAEVQVALRSYYRELCGSSTAPRGVVPGSVWSIPAASFKPPAHLGVKHFASFPVELVAPIIQGWSPAGGVVLDPMGGSGTTALVASVAGRVGITVDGSADYCRLASWRVADPKQRNRAASHVRPVTRAQEPPNNAEASDAA